MENTKFVKAVCTKTKKYFGLEIKQYGSVWRVVNFIPLSPEEANLMTSEVHQASFSTNENLLACDRCGKRLVGGCTCPPKTVDCRKHDEFHFQCIYCNNLEIDYSAPSLGHGHKEGDVIRLSQGQEVRIQSGDEPLSEIYVGVGWDPVSAGENMDIDSSVIVAGGDEKEVVYYSNLQHPSGCVIHHGDNVTGIDGEGNDDDENISVFLDDVPSSRDRLIFVLNIYKCTIRGQELGDVKNMYIRLYDSESGRAIVEYRVESAMRHDTALIIGVAYRKGGGWAFKAIGRGSRADSIESLAEEVMRLRL